MTIEAEKARKVDGSALAGGLIAWGLLLRLVEKGVLSPVDATGIVFKAIAACGGAALEVLYDLSHREWPVQR
jgi:hypothetical protein